MHQAKATIFALCALVGTGYGTPGRAMSVPFQDHLSMQYPGAPRPIRPDNSSPYAMTYADEVAQSLGVRDGHMDLFSTAPVSSYAPSFSAGVDKDGAMLRMRWHPGE